jgi:hypothetical protein
MGGTWYISDFILEAKTNDIEGLEPEEYYYLDQVLPTYYGGLEIEASAEISFRLVSLASSGLKNWGLPHGIDGACRNLGSPGKRYAQVLSKHLALRKIVDQIATAWAKGGKKPIRGIEGSFSWIATGTLIMFSFDSLKRSYLLSYEQLLMFKDLYYARFNALMAAYQVYGSYSLGDTMERVFSWFDQCLGRYGNGGYAIAKQIEALSKSHICRLTDDALGAHYMFERMLNVVREKEKSLGGVGELQADRLDKILASVKDLAYTVELFGLQKMFGHPLIDPKVGGDKVRDEARNRHFLNYADIRANRNQFCHMYTLGFIKVNGEWPPIVFSEEGRYTTLRELYARNETKVSDLSYDISDWEHATFAKHLDFDYFQNFLDLVDDRALSYYREDLAATWDRTVKPRSQKRLLLEMMSREDVSVFSIVEQVRKGIIPFSWMIVSLYPKEREFKEAARMFGMLVMEMRFFFAATEANLADHVFKYLPSQTMTLSKDEIEHLFHGATETPDGQDFQRLFIEIDLSSWNLHWHPEVVDPIGHTIEDIFGLPGVYTVVHHFFEQCVMMVRTSECKPDGLEDASVKNPENLDEESSLLWYYHRVGIEGQCQKLWTACTYPMIKNAVWHFGYRHYLIGQGDNQTLLFFLPRLSDLHNREFLVTTSNEILDCIFQSCVGIGQSVKQDECVISTRSLTYSKCVYIDGVPYYTSCKALSRVFPNASDSFPTLLNMVGGISSQCTAAAEYLKYPPHAYALWAFHFSLYFSLISFSTPVEAINITYSAKKKLGPGMILALCILPRSLGGLPIATCLGFIYKGGADPLSKDYASLKIMQHGSITARRLIASLHSFAWFDRSPDPSRIIDDPYSLPVLTTVTPEMEIFSHSIRKVHAKTRHRGLKDVLSYKTEMYENQLKRVLLSMQPLNPLIASDLLGWSLVGIKRMIGKMFTSTQTIQSLLHDDYEINPTRSILGTGAGEFLQILRRLERVPRVEREIQSIYSEVSMMRQQWFPDHSQELVGVTAYTPFESDIYCGPYPAYYHGVRAALPSNIGPESSFKRGGQVPYLGLRTREKRSEHGYRLITHSAPSRAIKRLSDILVQPGIDATTKVLISSIASTRGNINLRLTEPFLGHVYGGTITHRYNTRLGVRQAHGLSSIAIASQCIITTNFAHPLTGGEDDYPRMVQEDMVCAVSCCQIESNQTDMPIYVTVRYDNCSMIKYLDQTLFTPLELIPESPTITQSPFIYDANVTLEILAARIESAFVTNLSYNAGDKSIAPHALCRLVSRGLASSHSAQTISDLTAGEVRFAIGVPEVKGCGLNTVLHYTSLATARTVAPFFFRQSLDEPRWAVVPGLLSISAAIGRQLARLCRSGVLQDDPTLLKIQGLTPLRYMGEAHSLCKKLSGLVFNKVMKMLYQFDSPLYRYPVFLFGDEPAGVLVREVMTSYRIALLNAVYHHHMPIQHARKLSNGTLPQLLRRETNQSGKLNALYRLMAGLIPWAERNGHVSFSIFLRTIGQGTRFLQLQIPAVEALRLARSVRVVAELSISSTAHLLNHVSAYRIVQPVWRLSELMEPFGHVIWSENHNSKAYTEFTVRRLLGRSHGGDSSTGYSYLCIADYVRDRVVVNVGCGIGGGASVLLSSGAAALMGIDLDQDLTIGYDLDTPEYPPCIAGLNCRKRFTRLMSGPLARGDFFRAETVSAIRRNCTVGGVLVVDIPLLTRLDVVKVLRQAATLWETTETLIRWVGLWSQYIDIIATLCGSSYQCSGITVCRHGAYVEGWIYSILSLPMELKAVEVTEAESLDEIWTPLIHTSIPMGGEDHLAMLVLGPFSALSEIGDIGLLNDMVTAIGASIGPLDHRFSYKQWSEVLTSILAITVLKCDDQQQTLLDILSSEVYQVEIGGKTLDVSITPLRTRVLSRIVSRMLIAPRGRVCHL